MSADALTVPEGFVPATSSPSADTRIARLVSNENRALLSYFLRRVADREDAADLLAECFVILWRRRDAVPTEDLQARMWAFGVARKLLASYRRRTSAKKDVATELRGHLSQSVAPVEPELIEVRMALAKLRQVDQEIVTLHYWDGFSLEEIAVVLRKPAATIRSRLSRARHRLRVELEPMEVKRDS